MVDDMMKRVQAMDIKPGHIIKTSYGTGPYMVEKVHGPCNCPEYLSTINGDGSALPTPDHYHFIVRTHRRLSDTQSYLNAYFKVDDRYLCMWNLNDEIHVIGWESPTLIPKYKQPIKQLSLF